MKQLYQLEYLSGSATFEVDLYKYNKYILGSKQLINIDTALRKLTIEFTLMAKDYSVYGMINTSKNTTLPVDGSIGITLINASPIKHNIDDVEITYQQDMKE